MTDRELIADSSPLIALAVIDALDLLPRLYRRVLVPPAVWHEVTVAGAGQPGAETVRAASWIEFEQPPPTAAAPLQILVDWGEAAAIALAAARPGSILLLDDSRARRVAETLGLPRIGTLGVLRKAKESGMVDALAPLIQRLADQGIYVGAKLVDAVLRAVGERQ